MKSILVKILMVLSLLYSQIIFAGSGPLFYISSTTGLLQIKASMPHTYPNAGIKINTSGQNIRQGCTPSANGFCLFSVSNLKSANITVSTLLKAFDITLCLDGKRQLSCQKYSNISIDVDFSQFYAGTFCGIYHFLDITNTGLFVGRNDDVSYNVPLASGHPINLYGTTYSNLFMSTNGIITSLLNSNRIPSPLPIANLVGSNALIVYYADLDSRGVPPLGLYYQYFTLCPRPSTFSLVEGCHVFQWNTRFYPGTTYPSIFSFQTLVYERSGEVTYQYAAGNTRQGQNISTGVQNASLTSYVQLTNMTFGSVPPNSVTCLKHYRDNV